MILIGILGNKLPSTGLLHALSSMTRWVRLNVFATRTAQMPVIPCQPMQFFMAVQLPVCGDVH